MAFQFESFKRLEFYFKQLFEHPIDELHLIERFGRLKDDVR